jgi:16S rRNA (guanine527-N7)-methyltransferase
VTTDSFKALLDARARLAGLTIDSRITEGLELYFQCLSKWNRKINLAGFDLEAPTPAAIDRLLIEPIQAAKVLSRHPESMLDVGSGGGSPAIPMTLVLAPRRAVYVEARERKGVFLKEAIAALGLTGVVDVCVDRLESLPPDADTRYSLVTTRAVKLDRARLQLIASLMADDGRFIAFQGRDQELPDFPNSLGLTRTELTATGSTVLVYERVT